jgi:hypothetical protein
MRTVLGMAAGFVILAIGSLGVAGQIDEDPSCSFSVAADVCLVETGLAP